LLIRRWLLPPCHYYAAADAMIFTRFSAATPPRADYAVMRHAARFSRRERHFRRCASCCRRFAIWRRRLFFMPQRRRRREPLPQALPRRRYAAGLRSGATPTPLTLFRRRQRVFSAAMSLIAAIISPRLFFELSSFSSFSSIR
jgi:hypothetical protein